MAEGSGQSLKDEEGKNGVKGKALSRARSGRWASVEKTKKSKKVAEEEEGSEEGEEEEAVMVPEDFICALSSSVMEDPVVVASGQTFERRRIQAWLDSGHRNCPKTHQPLLHLLLIPNNTLKALISNWLRAHGISFPLSAADDDEEEEEICSLSGDSSALDLLPPLESSSPQPISLDSSSSSIAHDSSPLPDDASSPDMAIDGLVEDLQSGLSDLRQRAAGKLRILAKHNQDYRTLIAEAGAVRPLIGLLHSDNLVTQELAVTTLLNLSLNDSLKSYIAASGAIEPLVTVVCAGNRAARQNAALTLSGLATIDDNKARIGAAGAIPPLLKLLADGSLRGKKDAATALFRLSSLDRNQRKMVQSGAPKLLLELIRDPSSGMTDKAMAILSNLVTIQEGRAALVQEGGVSALVQAMEAGSCMRGKDLAISVLIRLCTDSSKRWWAGLMQQEGAIPTLEAVSRSSGNSRAKAKAITLLRKLREQTPCVSGESSRA